MAFSNRTPDDLTHNLLAQVAEGLQKPILDMTQSNPTHCQFNYPKNLLRGLSQSDSLLYEPHAFGLPWAREVLADYLSTTQGVSIAAENLLLTASTSEAYSYLFKLLGDPGHQFLTPSPGYPLLDHLLRLEALESVPYHLQMKPDWPVDRSTLNAALTSQTRGLVAINPHNPTGSFLSVSDQEVLLELCARESIAYISDEVFGDFADGPKPKTIQNKDVLSFHLGGFSKSLGLPQLKLAWMVIRGPHSLVTECKNRLELIADTYLSVNTPVQSAIKELLAFAPHLQQQIQNRVSKNRKQLEEAFRGLNSIKIWPAQGGWYALVEVMLEGFSDEDLALDLLKKHQVLVQPGWFYDFPQGCFLVLSLLLPEDDFQMGLNRIRLFLSAQMT